MPAVLGEAYAALARRPERGRAEGRCVQVGRVPEVEDADGDATSAPPARSAAPAVPTATTAVGALEPVRRPSLAVGAVGAIASRNLPLR